MPHSHDVCTVAFVVAPKGDIGLDKRARRRRVRSWAGGMGRL